MYARASAFIFDAIGRGVRASARTWVKARSAENWLGGALAPAGGGKAVEPRQDQASAHTQAMAATQLARPGDSGKADWVVTFFSLLFFLLFSSREGGNDGDQPTFLAAAALAVVMTPETSTECTSAENERMSSMAALLRRTSQL